MPDNESPSDSPALDWQLQPERLCKITGKARPRFFWPRNLPDRRTWYKRTGSTALAAAARKREAKAEAEQERYKTSRERLNDLDDQNKGVTE